MRNLREGERVIHMLHVLGPASDAMYQRAEKRITVPRIHPLQFLSTEGMGNALGLALSGNTRAPRYRDRDQRILEDHLRHGQFYNIFLMTQVDSPNRAGLARISNLVSSILLMSSDFNGLHPADNMPGILSRVNSPEAAFSSGALGRLAAWFESTDPQFQQVWTLLSADEIATLWHLPHRGFHAGEILYIPSGQVPAVPTLTQNTEGICLGISQNGNQKALVRMLDKDRGTHLEITGETGTGKSSFLHALIHQDIQSGKGVGVIDPHGKLVSDILRYSVPDHRIDDVVVLDIANEFEPPPLNPLMSSGEQTLLAAGQIVAVIDKIYEVKAQRAEDPMTAALITTIQDPTPTIRDVVRQFTDIPYRHRLLSQTRDAVTQEFWEEFEQMSPSVQRELSYPVIHRMRHFYRNPTLYPIICHPDALDFAHQISQKKIILLSLGIDERKVPFTERQLLGALLVSQIQMAVMQSLNKAVPFYLYVDEAQNFVTSSLEQLLAEARKYGLHLILAHQYLGQLKGRVLESVLGNVGAKVAFQSGLSDAKTLAPYFAPEFSAEDLINLPLYTAAVKMRFNGQTLPAFTLQTVPPPETLDIQHAKAREEMIRQRSIARYTPKTREEVLSWLNARYPSPATQSQKEQAQGPTDWSIPE